jgi:hypothetical protein
MRLLYFFTFLLCFANSNSQYVVNDNLMVQYDTLYSNNYRFSTALNDTYIIGTNTNNTNNCKYECAHNTNCLGIYENNDNDYYCNLLSNIEGHISVKENSNSIVRINHWDYPLEDHSFTFSIWDSYMFLQNKQIVNVTVYLDINHNGILDNDEPWIIANNSKKFVFDNITAGTYLVRQIPPDNCVQLYPGLNGSFILGDNNIMGDGYIDNIIRYKHHSHDKHGHPHGGYVNQPDIEVRNDNFSFVIGNDSSTFMSFYPKDSIEGIFIDESIINIPGYDLIINVLESNSATIANVSVSHDDHNFKYLGKLNGSISEHLFDLDDIDYNLPVNYVKLDFIGADEPLNIISIGSYNHSVYLPSFAYNINIPYYHTLIFLNDCHYDFSCEFYCDFNLLDDNDYYSCSHGCEVFEQTNACNCSSVLDLSDDDYYSNFELDHDYCLHGCEYGVQQHIFPNYTLISNNNGNNDAIITNGDTCDIDCLDKLVDKCDLINECRSVSFSEENMFGNLFGNYDHTYERNSFFIIKNSYFDTTSTTTITSTTITDTSTTSTTITDTSSTSTTITDTSTTSSTITDTSTSITDTSTSITDTSTSVTDTSISITDTSSTITSSTPHTHNVSNTTSTQYTHNVSNTTSTPHTHNVSNTTSTPHTHNVSNTTTTPIPSGISKAYKNIIIIVGSGCLVLILIVLITLLYRCIKNRNLPKQTHISIHNPVYQPNFEFETENGDIIKTEPSLYQDVDPRYEYDQISDNYLEIIND